ncbi:hypothetical protein BY996DRAFT_3740207 [Phakopsora pachyrhizi]|nr:hypothetical protein BY996DRAFT_3740207 [Phakopsora pachyrhizi]
MSNIDQQDISDSLFPLLKATQAVTITSLSMGTLIMLSLFHSPTQKNTVIVAILITCYFGSWISVPSFFGQTKDFISLSSPSILPRKLQTVCFTEGVLCAYFYVLLSGLSCSFAIEVMLYLRQVSRATGSDSSQSRRTTCINERRPNLVRLKFVTDERPTKEEDCFSETSIPELFIPFITAIPAAYFSLSDESRHNWLLSPWNKYACVCPNVRIRNKLAILELIHLAPASILNLGGLIFYIRVRHDVAWASSVRPHLPLLVRLGAMSTLTVVPIILHFALAELSSSVPIVACSAQSLSLIDF